jgi:hypothetical protein
VTEYAAIAVEELRQLRMNRLCGEACHAAARAGKSAVESVIPFATAICRIFSCRHSGMLFVLRQE